MTRARSVLLILFLLAGSLSPPESGAQGAEAARSPPTGEYPGFALEQNYPDPVNPQTWIPFNLSPSLFETRTAVSATMRIYNNLGQVIAITEAVDHPSGQGVRVINLEYTTPGRKTAYWDGRDSAGRQVPSGVYYVQLVIDDIPDTRKLIVLNNPRRRRILPW